VGIALLVDDAIFAAVFSAQAAFGAIAAAFRL
jgi:hypothetical protein